ncbi:MAG: DUF899 family protein [Gammaproteobacteria bacterium]|nr:DUF899 family protein [Gammaproteobacteria bacterium]
MTISHDKRFPNESDEYRSARNELLEAERELRRNVESVAELRRRLPPGGKLTQDYVFESLQGEVLLSSLFGAHDSLILYNFMFAPGKDPCPMCTSLLDSLDGAVRHLEQQVSFAVVAKAPLSEVSAFAVNRGWRHLRLLSSGGNDYNRDYHGETSQGQWPMLNVFRRRGNEIRHTWGSELMFTKADPGQNQRHVDLLWPLWNLLDLTPGGRGDNWYPRREYQDTDSP